MTDTPHTSPASAPAEDPRTAELRERLEGVRRRIREATAAAGRTDEPELVVVTKTHPAEDVLRLAGLGVADVGENRDQEARPKAAAVAEALGASGPRWHFVGQLQTNKAKHVVRYAAAVHSVDRAELVDALSRAVTVRRERTPETALPDLDCLVQVDVDDRPDELRPEGIGPRGGAAPTDVETLADRIVQAPGLRLRGLMCVAPRGVDPEQAFGRLAELSARLRRAHPGAGALSMGMSADLEAAVRAGATHVRIGSDILGARGAAVG
ncbi:YggS family pyridoxal phosphate-dependent enzyme [Micrococcus sp.]|uniref:YggS family pyridoxal phosphate-dependent enzyme n=1 Tax=Micrococcus sp. TaxID=1271 RepID=UPI002A91EB52|nr:YggS family pyridoxal phosphate-dependent enzyme [Micrococcus sp.]MDY6055557.1 YggS family pyridoxal phosphate-dependent enzyme [Micrococcus sp.]